MNEYLTAALLGIIQGLTEFLPVSSTGHLIIFERLFGAARSIDISFDVAVHLASSLAVIIYFWQDWTSMTRKTIVLIAIGTLPAAVTGYFLEDRIIERFRTLEAVALGLAAGSILIAGAEYWHGRNQHRDKTLTVFESFFIGCFQALALFPGISRSGATISGGLLLGKDRSKITRFSFLLATPIILGASFKTFVSTNAHGGAVSLPVFAIGFAAALIAALFALRLLTRMMEHRTLLPFVWYRMALAGILLIIIFF